PPCEATLLARLDKGETACALVEEIGGAGPVGEQGCGAEPENEARLVIAGRSVARALASRRDHLCQFGRRKRGVQQRENRAEDRDRGQLRGYRGAQERPRGTVFVEQPPGEETQSQG